MIVLILDAVHFIINSWQLKLDRLWSLHLIVLSLNIVNVNISFLVLLTHLASLLLGTVELLGRTFGCKSFFEYLVLNNCISTWCYIIASARN